MTSWKVLTIDVATALAAYVKASTRYNWMGRLAAIVHIAAENGHLIIKRCLQYNPAT